MIVNTLNKETRVEFLPNVYHHKNHSIPDYSGYIMFKSTGASRAPRW